MQTHLLFAASLALLLAAPAALGAHMTNYATNPVEHDDQGRSNEPDGARSGLYDGAVADCTVDLDGDGRCTAADLAAWPGGEVVAQGCTDDAGRQPSGLCGLHTVGVGLLLTGGVVPYGTAGATGITGPCPFPAGQRALRVLDQHQLVFPTTMGVVGHPIFDVNRKLQDAGYFAIEQQLGIADGSDVVAGGAAMLAWYGLFLDRNCNGVIDHFGTAQSDARNEFTWVGTSCKDGAGNQVVGPDVCREEATELLGWEVPGNHHAIYGGSCITLECGLVFVPGDAPGRLALCALQGGGSADCDAAEAEFYGDPLLGPQGDNAPDWYFYPGYLGDPSPYNRVYVSAFNWPVYHYDPSLVVTTTTFAAVNPVAQAEGAYDLNRAALVDVDVLKTRNPALEAYVQGLVKPTLRSAWLTLREAL